MENPNRRPLVGHVGALGHVAALSGMVAMMMILVGSGMPMAYGKSLLSEASQCHPSSAPPRKSEGFRGFSSNSNSFKIQSPAESFMQMPSPKVSSSRSSSTHELHPGIGQEVTTSAVVVDTESGHKNGERTALVESSTETGMQHCGCASLLSRLFHRSREQRSSDQRSSEQEKESDKKEDTIKNKNKECKQMVRNMLVMHYFGVLISRLLIQVEGLAVPYLESLKTASQVSTVSHDSVSFNDSLCDDLSLYWKPIVISALMFGIGSELIRKCYGGLKPVMKKLNSGEYANGNISLPGPYQIFSVIFLVDLGSLLNLIYVFWTPLATTNSISSGNSGNGNPIDASEEESSGSYGQENLNSSGENLLDGAKYVKGFEVLLFLFQQFVMYHRWYKDSMGHIDRIFPVSLSKETENSTNYCRSWLSAVLSMFRHLASCVDEDHSSSSCLYTKKVASKKCTIITKEEAAKILEEFEKSCRLKKEETPLEETNKIPGEETVSLVERSISNVVSRGSGSVQPPEEGCCNTNSCQLEVEWLFQCCQKRKKTAELKTTSNRRKSGLEQHDSSASGSNGTTVTNIDNIDILDIDTQEQQHRQHGDKRLESSVSSLESFLHSVQKVTHEKRDWIRKCACTEYLFSRLCAPLGTLVHDFALLFAADYFGLFPDFSMKVVMTIFAFIIHAALLWSIRGVEKKGFSNFDMVSRNLPRFYGGTEGIPGALTFMPVRMRGAIDWGTLIAKGAIYRIPAMVRAGKFVAVACLLLRKIVKLSVIVGTASRWAFDLRERGQKEAQFFINENHAGGTSSGESQQGGEQPTPLQQETQSVSEDDVTQLLESEVWKRLVQDTGLRVSPEFIEAQKNVVKAIWQEIKKKEEEQRRKNEESNKNVAAKALLKNVLTKSLIEEKKTPDNSEKNPDNSTDPRNDTEEATKESDTKSGDQHGNLSAPTVWTILSSGTEKTEKQEKTAEKSKVIGELKQVVENKFENTWPIHCGDFPELKKFLVDVGRELIGCELIGCGCASVTMKPEVPKASRQRRSKISPNLETRSLLVRAGKSKMTDPKNDNPSESQV